MALTNDQQIRWIFVATSSVLRPLVNHSAIYSSFAYLGAAWRVLGASLGRYEPLGTILGPLGVILRPLGRVLGPLGAILGPLVAVLGPLGAVSWGHVGTR